MESIQKVLILCRPHEQIYHKVLATFRRNKKRSGLNAIFKAIHPSFEVFPETEPQEHDRHVLVAQFPEII